MGRVLQPFLAVVQAPAAIIKGPFYEPKRHIEPHAQTYTPLSLYWDGRQTLVLPPRAHTTTTTALRPPPFPIPLHPHSSALARHCPTPTHPPFCHGRASRRWHPVFIQVAGLVRLGEDSVRATFCRCEKCIVY